MQSMEEALERLNESLAERRPTVRDSEVTELKRICVEQSGAEQSGAEQLGAEQLGVERLAVSARERTIVSCAINAVYDVIGESLNSNVTTDKYAAISAALKTKFEELDAIEYSANKDELRAKNDALIAENAALRAKNEALRAKNEALRAENASLREALRVMMHTLRAEEHLMVATKGRDDSVLMGHDNAVAERDNAVAKRDKAVAELNDMSDKFKNFRSRVADLLKYGFN